MSSDDVRGAARVSEPQQRLGPAFTATLLSTAVPALAGVVSSIALARTLDPFSRGEMATVLLWPMALGILGDPGVSFALSFQVSRERESASGLWTIGLLMALVWGGFLAAFGSFVLPAVLSLSLPARLALLLTLGGVPLTLLNLYACYLLLGGGRLGSSNFVRGSGLVLYAAGVLLLAATGRGSILAYAAAWLVSQLVASALAAVLVHRDLGAGWQWQPRLLRPVFSYGIRVYASSLAGHTSIRLDQLLMSLMGLSVQLGFYVVAVAVASATAPFFTALAILALQRVTASSSVSESAREVRGVLRICVLLGIPMVVIGVIAVQPLLPAIFGQAYVESTIPAQILLAAAFFLGANAIFGNVLRGLGLPGRPAVAEGIGSLLTILLLVWLLPRYGAVGAAVASLSVYAVVFVFQLRFVHEAGGLAGGEKLRRHAP